jgi:hypothetical protein
LLSWPLPFGCSLFSRWCSWGTTWGRIFRFSVWAN